MDKRVGPLLDKSGCGFNSGLPGNVYDSTLTCSRVPVVVHFIFNTIDEDGYFPGGFACEEHKDGPPKDLIKMQHPVEPFCTLPGSNWDLELNECVMPLEYYEKELLGEVMNTDLVSI